MADEVAPAEGGQGEATAVVAEHDAAPAPSVSTETPALQVASGFSDNDLQEWVQSKFNGSTPSVEQLAGSYRNLEKMVGADRAGRTVVLPGPDADEAEMAAFYEKMGRPESADGYELPVPEGDDGAMAEWARGVFHGAGLTPKQAQQISEAWNDHVANISQSSAQQSEQSAADAMAELKREWGAAYDQKTASIEHAARALELSDDDLNGLRSSMGPANAMRFVDKLASKLGEDVVLEGEAAGGALTPQSAHMEIQKLGTDPEFMKAWMDRGHPSHKWAVEHKANLARMAAGRAA